MAGGKGAICRDKGQLLGSSEDTHGCNPLQLAAQTASAGHVREALTPRPRFIHMKGRTLTLFMRMTFCAGGGGAAHTQYDDHPAVRRGERSIKKKGGGVIEKEESVN